MSAAIRVLAFDSVEALLEDPARSARADAIHLSYLPLALGLVLERARLAVPAGAYRLEQPFVSSERDLVDAVSGEGPAISVFSDYVWSIGTNLQASRAAKQADARCLTIHGGPSVPKHPTAAADFLAKNRHIDVLVRGEGEATFADLLARSADALHGPRRARDAAFREVHGITFVDQDGAIVQTPDRASMQELDSTPSPYLSGLFDDLLAQRHPNDSRFTLPHATLETNRGCPYGCTFCDWGSATLQKIRLFSMDRIRAELEWLARHRTLDVFIADANFGILPRDVAIASVMADVKNVYGYPRQITVNYAKNGSKRLPEIFRIWKDAGFQFESVIAMQTTDTATLAALNRLNIKNERHVELSETFRELSLPVRVHLMLGLPGQTIASFMTDLQVCFERQEDVQIFLTRLLPNSPMADPEYMKRYGIRADAGDIVCETTTFSAADRDFMHAIGYAFLLYTNWAILRYVLLYLQWDHGIRALDFIRAHVEDVIAHAEQSPEAGALLGPALAKAPLGAIEQAPAHLSRFQKGAWGAFYAEVAAFVARRYGVARDSAFDAVLSAQEAIMPHTGAPGQQRFTLAHDVCAYVEQGVAAMRQGRAPTERLATFGPGALVVTDPLGANRADASERGTPVGGPDPRWALASRLDPRWSNAEPRHAKTGPDAEATNFPAVLYVHPVGHLNDLSVPSGALTCLNAVRATKLGRYAFEVTDDEIAQARILAVDVHWALALPGFARLVGHVRKLRPDLPIVVGGITAGHYAAELLARYPVDYVVQGDSEIAFARLIEALLAGTTPDGIPNVHGRNLAPAPPERMTDDDYDATDCITCDWFPTYASVSNWDSVAFGPGRTIVITRGCPQRCPECYGSYASTYGDGYLMRSGEGVSRLLRRAQAEGARNVRLVVCKPSPQQLGALVRGIADGGPYSLDGDVGFYICTPPTPEDLSRLEAAFDGKITMSLVPPEEHYPPLGPERLTREQEAWKRVATHAAGSKSLRLDVWSTTRSDVDEVRGDMAPPENKHVKASYGAVWAVTRPVDGSDVPYDEVIDAVAPVWTFYAARLLSPALGSLLAPFRFLDELDGDPLAVEPPRGTPRAFYDLVAKRWRTTRLPTLPGLRFAVLPARATSTSPQSRHGVFVSGALTFADTGDLAVLGPPSALEEQPDHRGVDLRAQLESLPDGADTLAIVPVPLAGSAVDAAWLETVGATAGVLVVKLGKAAPALRELVVHLRVQDARAFALDASGAEIARGVAHLGYFRPTSRRPPRAASARQLPAG